MSFQVSSCASLVIGAIARSALLLLGRLSMLLRSNERLADRSALLALPYTHHLQRLEGH